MILGCPQKAAALAEESLSSGDPLLIKALCQAGLIEKALEKLGDDNDSLEEVCWSYITKGKNSSSLFHRWVSLQLAADLHSYRSVPFILSALQDSNIALRQTACELATVLQDQVLISELKKRASTDSNPDVRLSALSSLAKIQAKGMEALMIFDGESLTHEKITMIASLATLRDKVELAEVKTLVQSSRALMRLFAINLVLSSGQNELFQALLPLARDTHPMIRMAFCEAAVVLKQEKVPSMEPESDYRVAITEEWMRVCYGESTERLEKYLHNENPKARSLAAVALGKLGRWQPLQKRLNEEEDPFVRLNMAMALLPYDEKAGFALMAALEAHKGLLMRTCDYSPALPLILPSELSKCELMNGEDADSHDLNVRMELLHQLACKNSQEAIEALKNFLKDKRFGKAMLSSFVLLQEGDEETARLIQQLLYSDDEEISLQAALLLGMLFSDPEALFVLKSNYEVADHEMKLRIIEALGRIGDKDSVPFLKKQLKDPSLLIQILSAWAIISIVNQ